MDNNCNYKPERAAAQRLLHLTAAAAAAVIRGHLRAAAL